MVSHHSAKFSGHSSFGSGDIKFSVAEEEDSGCPHIYSALLFL